MFCERVRIVLDRDVRGYGRLVLPVYRVRRESHLRRAPVAQLQGRGPAGPPSETLEAAIETLARPGWPEGPHSTPGLLWPPAQQYWFRDPRPRGRGDLSPDQRRRGTARMRPWRVTGA